MRDHFFKLTDPSGQRVLTSGKRSFNLYLSFWFLFLSLAPYNQSSGPGLYSADLECASGGLGMVAVAGDTEASQHRAGIVSTYSEEPSIRLKFGFRRGVNNTMSTSCS